jgi:F0F1-type ATP synthase membrane subunit b/b'
MSYYKDPETSHFSPNAPHMKEIVDRILREEEGARKRIEAARQEAQEALRQATAQSQTLIDKAVADAQAETEARKLQAQRQFGAEKETSLKETQESVAARRDEKARDIPALAHKFFLSLIHIQE